MKIVNTNQGFGSIGVLLAQLSGTLALMASFAFCVGALSTMKKMQIRNEPMQILMEQVKLKLRYGCNDALANRALPNSAEWPTALYLKGSLAAFPSDLSDPNKIVLYGDSRTNTVLPGVKIISVKIEDTTRFLIGDGTQPQSLGYGRTGLVKITAAPISQSALERGGVGAGVGAPQTFEFPIIYSKRIDSSTMVECALAGTQRAENIFQLEPGLSGLGEHVNTQGMAYQSAHYLLGDGSAVSYRCRQSTLSDQNAPCTPPLLYRD